MSHTKDCNIVDAKKEDKAMAKNEYESKNNAGNSTSNSTNNSTNNSQNNMSNQSKNSKNTSDSSDKSTSREGAPCETQALLLVDRFGFTF